MPPPCFQPLTAPDGDVVRRFLYHALYVPAGQPPSPPEIGEQPVQE